MSDLGGWGEGPRGWRNTVSNLAYALAGTWVALAVGTPEAEAFGFAMIVLCFGSGLYHMTDSRWGQWLDHLGMYLVLSGITALAWLPPSPNRAVWMLLFGLAFSLGVRYGVHAKLNPVIGGLLLLAVLPPLYLGRGAPALLAVGVLAGAYAFQRLDVRPNPVTGKWGHAIWHAVSSVGLALLFLAQQPGAG